MNNALGGRGLFAIDASGENLRLVFDSDQQDFYPSWAPDGKTLAVVLRSEEGSDIYEISESGQIIRQLTNSGN